MHIIPPARYLYRCWLLLHLPYNNIVLFCPPSCQLNISYKVLPSKLTLKDQTKFYAAFGVAISDASVVGWGVKYNTLFWRPITAIRNGDGVNAPIPSWTPLLATPAHPKYASGHMFTVGAAYEVIKL